MAYIALTCNPNAVQPSAQHVADPSTTGTVGTTAVAAAIAAAAANTTIAGNAPALALVNAITTAVNALVVTNPGLAAPIVLLYDPTIVLTKNAIKQSVDSMLRMIFGSRDLT